MKFKKLTLRNIRSYKNEEIEFPDGSLLLSGEIGSGKTSILLAIEYALFGLQPGQKGLALLRNNANTGEVALELEIDGKTIIIERKLKRNPRSVSNEYAAITIDGEKIESSITELKIKVLNLLGYPLDFIKKNNLLYRYTVYTPQENMKKIILEDPETRLNILRHVFGIEKYKRIRENLVILLNNLKENSKILEGEIKSLDHEKEIQKSLNSLIENISSDIALKEANFESKISKRKQIKKELSELESKIKEKEKFGKEAEKTSLMIATKDEILSSIKKEFEETSQVISGLDVFEETNLTQISMRITQENELIEKLQSTLIELNSQITALEKNQEENTSKKERFFKIDLCPTCLQDVSDAHKHNILNATEQALAEIKKNLENHNTKRNELIGIFEKEKSLLAELNEKKANLELLKSKWEYAEKSKTRLKSLNNQRELLKEDLTLLSKHLNTLKQSILEFSKFDNFFKIKQDELNKALQIEKNSEISLAESKKELELTKRELKNLKQTISEKEKSKLKLSKILELIDWLSNQFHNLINFTERNIMMKLRLEFSKLFSKWFQMLMPENPFQVHLDENFTPLVLQNEFEMDYGFLSGGERTALALAYRLALNQTINSVLSKIKTKNIVILDEPTDGFSEIQLDKMRDVLDELNAEQLIIVSHEQKIEGFVDNVLKLNKENNSSHLENAAEII